MSDTPYSPIDAESRPRPLRRLKRLLAAAAAHPGYALSRLPMFGELIAAVAPPRQPPILLLSMPRAGSSWIGGILGASEGALYLREPLHQTFRARIANDRSALFEFDTCSDQQAYAGLATLTFKGIPRFNQGVVQYPSQWAIGRRRRKQPVIKEVNPLIVDYLWERFKPRVIFLTRHPAPIARSYEVLGWHRDLFTTAFRPEAMAELERQYVLPTTRDFWEQSGAFHAITQNRVMDFLAKTDHTVMRYEDVCERPLEEFSRLFDFCGLPLSDALRQTIVASSQGDADYVPGRYDTVRNSRDMCDRWKREIDPDKVDRLRRAYLANRPCFYAEEHEWPLRPESSNGGEAFAANERAAQDQSCRGTA